MCICACVHVCMCACACVHVHVCICACDVCICTCACVHMHAQGRSLRAELTRTDAATASAQRDAVCASFFDGTVPLLPALCLQVTMY